MSFQINQKAWYVCRDNFANNSIEYLDNDADVFVKHALGYPTKAEAQERADKYQFDKKGMFLQGPLYGRYRISDTRIIRKKSFNTELCRFEIMDKMVQQSIDKTTKGLEMKETLRRFVYQEGVWNFTGLAKLQRFLYLCKKYEAFTDKELASIIYDFV